MRDSKHITDTLYMYTSTGDAQSRKNVLEEVRAVHVLVVYIHIPHLVRLVLHLIVYITCTVREVGE